MRAAQYDRYGPPTVLHLSDTAIPAAGPGELIIRVAGTSVNQIDETARSGGLRLVLGFRFPKGTGVDFAGEVIALGTNVDDISVGDHVWGFIPGQRRGPTGAAAQYLVARRDQLSLAPGSIPAVDAAALPFVAVTALTGLTKHLALKPGARLLVRGAGGGVGTAAVQLGKALGAHVTALTSGDTLDLVRGLGADAALDYKTHGTSSLGRYDAILDLTGTRLAAYRALLAPGGRMVTTATKGIPYILFSAIFGPRRVRAFVVGPSADLMAALTGFVDAAQLRPVIHREFPLGEIAAAQQALLDGGVAGKITVRVAD